MNLQNDNWANLDGGHRTPYDASIPLKKLRSTNDPKIITNIFRDLWDNLHHQGDVGHASYFSVPTLVDICIPKTSLDWNFIGLCLVIEHCRFSSNNPILPKQFEQEYFDSLSKFEQYLLTHFKKIKDKTSLRLTLSLFATLNEQRELGKAINQLDEDTLEQFLTHY